MKRRPDGRWLVQRTINGKTVYFYSKESTELKALRDIDRQIEEYEAKNNAPCFTAVAEAWKEKHLQEIAYRTWTCYQAHYKRAIEEFGDQRIVDITPRQIQAFLDRLASMDFAYKTVKSAYDTLSMIFAFAYRAEIVDQNPCDRVTVPKGLKKGKRALPSEDQIRRVIDGLHCHFGAFAYLLLYTGLRRGELLALSADCIDYKKRVIHIRKSVYFEGNQAVLKDPKTAAGKRDVPLLDCLIPVLQGKEGYIFGEDHLMSEQGFRRHWERYCRESGVTVTPHQLRHAYATMLLRAGIKAKSAQALLGHANIQTTMNIYTHISDSIQREDFEKLNSLSASQSPL